MTEPPIHPITLDEMQQHIRNRYFESDHARGTPGTFMWFVEEVGELATALHKNEHSNLAEEFADVLAWLSTLANINDIDLTQAFRDKYLRDGGPPGHK